MDCHARPPKKIGSNVFGSALLISGCCIGAGMLGMPVISGPYGFFPTFCMFLLGGGYMLLSGFFVSDLLVDEREKGVRHVHLLALAESILGVWGRGITWGLFCFLFYSVLTAYTIGLALIIQEIVELFFGRSPFSFQAYSAISLCLSLPLLLKGTRAVDYINRAAMVGLIAAYIVIVTMASTEVEVGRLCRANWTFSLFSTMPVIVFSFGFHNLIPTVASYLHFDRAAIRRAILFGTLFSFVVYVIWEGVIFGLIPFASASDWNRFIRSGEPITKVISESIGVNEFTSMALLFSLFSVLTSYLTVAMSMTDFIQSGIESDPAASSRKDRRWIYVLLSLVPPFAIAVSHPTIFLSALSYAGGVVAIILFGILPAVCRLVSPSVRAANSPSWKIVERLMIAVLLIGGLFVMSMECFYK